MSEKYPSQNTEQSQTASEIPGNKELRESLNNPQVAKFWSRFQRLVLTAGLGLAMAACGISRKEIEQMPETKVEDLVNNGLNAYRDKGYIKTRGIPTYLGPKDVKRFELDSALIGNSRVYYTKTVVTRTDFFKLRANPEPNSPSIDMIADGGESQYVFLKEDPKGSGLKGTREYQIVGTVVDAEDQQGKKTPFFKVDSVQDKTIEEYSESPKKQ